MLPLSTSWRINSQAFPCEEMLLEAYTPREHLLFQSSLRMPRDVTKAQREQRVDASIKMLPSCLRDGQMLEIVDVWLMMLEITCWGFLGDFKVDFRSFTEAWLGVAELHLFRVTTHNSFCVFGFFW